MALWRIEVYAGGDLVTAALAGAQDLHLRLKHEEQDANRGFAASHWPHHIEDCPDKRCKRLMAAVVDLADVVLVHVGSSDRRECDSSCPACAFENRERVDHTITTKGQRPSFCDHILVTERDDRYCPLCGHVEHGDNQ